MKRKGTEVIAAALAAGMLIPSVAFAAGPVVKVASDSSVQMSSDPEVVYVNNYEGTTRSESFNDNWKFYLGDASGADAPEFDDSGWRQVNLPHDYSIEQQYSQSMEAESGYLPGGTGWYRKNFTLDESAAGKQIRIDFGGVYMNSTVWINGIQVGTHPYGYTPFSFDITEHVKIGEENVITVKVDHQTPSSRWYSGSGIYRSVDLTITNPVHVDLYGTKIETPDLETEQGSAVTTNITTTVANDSEQNQSVTLRHTVFNKGGDAETNIGMFESTSVDVTAGSTEVIEASGTVTSPTLWSTKNPALYTVRTEVIVDGQIVDTYDTDYGFRYFEFDADTGFSLNGENMKLKGVCMHHDQGALGAEAWERAMERQVEILKEMGCNSIRVTHNPASDEFIEICNEQGILVIDETFDGWMYPKNGNSNDYSVWFNRTIGSENQIIGAQENMTWAQFDLTATVKRGWNAPSIIMWSLGNEIQEGTAYELNETYRSKQAELIAWTTALDDTRPVTRGDNRIKGNTSGMTVTMMDELSDAGGTAGMNYNNGSQYDIQHVRHPDWYIYGAETASSVNSRGVYDKLGNGNQQAPSDQKLTSYDNSRVGWGALASSAWYDVIQRDFVAGEYVWTGFDYIGEPTPWNGTGSGKQGTWPSPKNSYFGIIDTAGFPKDSYYFYQSQWNDEVRTLHILPAWNENVVAKDNSGQVPVVVYTDADKVELYFTSADTGERRLIGEKEFTEIRSNDGNYTYKFYEGEDANTEAHKNLYFTWNVTYEAGTIEAVAYDKTENGYTKIADTEGRSYVTTTGDEKKLSASADRSEISADGADLTYITVDVTDENGNTVPDAVNNVKFEVEGEGKLVGVDNGRQDDHQSYQDDNRNAFSGKVLAIVQSTKNAGRIKVTASAEGLEPSTVEIRTTPVSDESGRVTLNYYELSRFYYVKTGNMPQLPAIVKAAYSDGTTKDVGVTWESIPEELTMQTGAFLVTGTTAEGDKLSVTVNMIDEVAALLNYSTTVPVGQPPVLPDSRPAVLQNGDVISASFPVAWDEPEGSYETEGVVTVNGVANVLGKDIEVSASIRVQEQTVTIGSNVAGSAHLSQDVPQEQQSDTLDAIKDGSLGISDNMSGGANPSVWSNWGSRTTDPESEITFSFDTQQRIGQIIVYFARDNSSMTFPSAGTTELYISETGDDESWVKLDATETIASSESPTRVKAYTYSFAPTTATYIKLRVVNAKQTGNTVPCTGITEVQINEWTGTYTTNSTAALTALNVNGLTVSESNLEAGVFNTEATVIDSVDYEPADNAAVTYIPPYNNVATLIIESEDHSKRNTFVINLGADLSNAGSAEDDSRDYDYTQMAAQAGSQYEGTSSTDGTADWAIDGKMGTWWHTNYPGATPLENRWLTLTLNETQTIDGYRYYSRGGQANGRVGQYKIEVSLNGTEWTTVAEGEWSNTEGWKLAEFSPIQAQHIRLTGVTTYGAGNQANQFMTAAEVRIRLAENLTDISKAAVSIPNKEVSIVDGDHPVILTADEITVTLGDAVLRYGVDYTITYENNTSTGTATATITGLGQYGYTGSVSADFTITLRDPALESISIKVPCRTNYTEGETLDPSGLVLELTYDDGTIQEVAYTGNETAFDFSPNLSTVLTTAHEGTAVTVTYAGMTTQFTIRVNDTATPDPEQPVTNTTVSAQPVKTSYTAGETFDPTGLTLTLTYADGTTRTVVYSAATASGFTFDPPLGTPLTASDTSIRVTYGGASATINISTAANTGGTNPGTSTPVTPTDPPANASQSVSQAVETGDTAKVALLTASAIFAGVAAIITFLWRKRPTR